MTKKRFEIKVNQNNQYDIIDWVESKEKNALCIYNDLGNYDFSSAKALCKLLNDLNDECEFLEIDNEALEHGATRYAELYHEVLKEKKELTQHLQNIQDSFELRITKNYEEFNKDKIYIKDMNTKLFLDGNDLFIEVYIPQANEYHRFSCNVVGRSLSEYIESDNSREVWND